MAYYNDIYEVIDSLDVSNSWKETFKKIYTVYYQNFSDGKAKNVHFWSPSPLISVLGILDKWQFHCLFNFWALIFGPLYYFAKGMFMKGIILLLIWIELFTVNDMAAYLVVFIHIYCAILVNSDYFMLKVAKHKVVKQHPALLGDYVNETYFNKIVDNPRRKIAAPLFAFLITGGLIGGFGYFFTTDIIAFLAISEPPSVCKNSAECKEYITQQRLKLQTQEGEKYNEAYKLACAYAISRDQKNAFTAIEISILANPKFVPSRLLKAALYFDVQKYQQAITEYKKVLELNPRLKSLNFNIGRCYYRMREYSRALEYFKIATKKYPFNPMYLEIQGYTKVYLNDKAGARKDLERAINLYSSSDSEDSQKRINTIRQYLSTL